MASSNDIRAAFLDYFARNGHQVVRKLAAGAAQRPHADVHQLPAWCSSRTCSPARRSAPTSRATTAQKCVRAGGKHNDLDNVGYTARHHTFFEMLGNFSFGDYFKEQAIPYAWELVTKDFGLPTDRLLVTVYAEDDDAAAIWRKVAGLPRRAASSASPPPTISGAWAIPARAARAARSSTTTARRSPAARPAAPDEDGDRFVEIWNLVFMQFEEGPPGTRVAAAAALDRHRHGAGALRRDPAGQARQLRHRHVPRADPGQRRGHRPGSGRPAFASAIAWSPTICAAIAFLIADGVLPSNEGRGYVLRRIMRRAMRHAHMMGAREPLMYRLVPALVRQMGAAYPGTGARRGADRRDAAAGGDAVPAMLDRGLHLLAEETARLGDGQPLPGAVAFRLYDTFGFPLDLTQDALREQGRAVDLAGFEAAMEEQRAPCPRRLGRIRRGRHRARLVRAARRRSAPPSSSATRTETAEAEIIAPGRGRRTRSQRAEAGAEVAVVLNQTPFYGESGGQVGDTGTHHRRRRAAHRGDRHAEEAGRPVRASRPRRGGRGATSARRCWRRSITRAAPRSARITPRRTCCTRRCAGGSATHVTQKGSLNAPDRLRFDVSPAARRSTGDDLAWVEAEVNARIRENSRGDDAADDAGRRGRDGRDGAVRREIRRGGARRRDGRRRGQQARPSRSSCAAARMCGAPAISATSASCRRARSPPACAASRR